MEITMVRTGVFQNVVESVGDDSEGIAQTVDHRNHDR
jgi:hypothetical protein